ncbi:MAG: tail fiber domain-containing protein, partial [Saprospiraceae bacterium]|nr:tail fiber domain-containing protein [Saprospiraceae bacterium]
VPGLSFILKLEPVTYNLDVSALSKALGENQGKELNEQMTKAIVEKENRIQTGFIAQDVEKIAKIIGYNFSGVDEAKNEKDMYGLRYAEFVVPLVKAVQELNEELNAKNTLLNAELITHRSEIDRLRANNQKLITRLEKVEALIGVGAMEYTSLDTVPSSIPKVNGSSN